MLPSCQDRHGGQDGETRRKLVFWGGRGAWYSLICTQHPLAIPFIFLHPPTQRERKLKFTFSRPPCCKASACNWGSVNETQMHEIWKGGKRKFQQPDTQAPTDRGLCHVWTPSITVSPSFLTLKTEAAWPLRHHRCSGSPSVSFLQPFQQFCKHLITVLNAFLLVIPRVWRYQSTIGRKMAVRTLSLNEILGIMFRPEINVILDLMPFFWTNRLLQSSLENTGEEKRCPENNL